MWCEQDSPCHAPEVSDYNTEFFCLVHVCFHIINLILFSPPHFPPFILMLHPGPSTGFCNVTVLKVSFQFFLQNFFSDPHSHKHKRMQYSGKSPSASHIIGVDRQWSFKLGKPLVKKRPCLRCGPLFLSSGWMGIHYCVPVIPAALIRGPFHARGVGWRQEGGRRHIFCLN